MSGVALHHQLTPFGVVPFALHLAEAQVVLQVNDTVKWCVVVLEWDERVIECTKEWESLVL